MSEEPRKWRTVEVTVAAPTQEELESITEDVTDGVMAWAEGEEDREVHVTAKDGVPPWVEAP